MTDIPLDHPRFKSVDSDVFIKRVVADCMTHDCTQQVDQKMRHDACCQYGCDINLFEKAAIEKRREDIAKVMSPEAQAAPWFDESEIFVDNDVPSGHVIRSAVMHDGCVFLQHDGRGCGIHRAAIEQGWNFREAKPSICWLYPMSYENDEIFLSSDYPDYSCAFSADAPTVYQVCRGSMRDVFGDELVAALDAAEAKVLGRRLPVITG